MENSNADRFQVQTEETTAAATTHKRKPSAANNLRTRHCSKLRRLLALLIQQRNWKEASGVLSVLLKGTTRETFTQQNRDKYLATMEILNKMESGQIKLTIIRNVYEIWIRKNGAMKKSPAKDKFSAHLEFVSFCLTHGNIDEANQTLTSLMQETEYGRDPVLNMIAGLIYYELWYTCIPKEMKLKGSDIYARVIPSEVSGSDSCNSVKTSSSSSVYLPDVKSAAQGGNNKNQYIGTLDNMQAEPSKHVFQPQRFYIEDSAEMSGDEETCYDANWMDMSIFKSCGIEASLLPIRLPELNESFGNSISTYMEMLKDYYPKAVKHLQFSLHSTPPVLASLLPLVQLLLLGGKVEEALKELESLCQTSNAVLPFRIRAILLECFGSKDSIMLSTSYEDTMKRDPTCSQSLTRLITMHKNGDYGLVPVLEMIALHLDATHASSSVWGELASCFIKLSQEEEEEDQMSVRGNADEGVGKRRPTCMKMIPLKFMRGDTRKSWKLRCRWWCIRYFSKNAYVSEMESGEWELLTCKAACASHLYGRECEYVVSVHSYLEKKREQKQKQKQTQTLLLLLMLQFHMKNSINVSHRFKFEL